MLNRFDMTLELAGGVGVFLLGVLYGGILAPLDGWFTVREQIVAGAALVTGGVIILHAAVRMMLHAASRWRSRRHDDGGHTA